MRYMNLDAGMNVRLTPALKARLKHVAEHSNLKVADLIRMAVEEYCDRLDRDGQLTIKVPPKRKTA